MVRLDEGRDEGLVSEEGDGGRSLEGWLEGTAAKTAGSEESQIIVESS